MGLCTVVWLWCCGAATGLWSRPKVQGAQGRGAVTTRHGACEMCCRAAMRAADVGGRVGLGAHGERSGAGRP